MAHEYGKETLSKEFKSDLKGLPDSELVEAVVALANTDGGCVYLGVEDDGTPTGVKQKHQDPIGMAAMIANRTVPPISVRSELVGDDIKVVQVEVPKSQSVVSTKSGKILRRMMKMDGTPESVPMYPYEIATRLSDLGRLDYSAQPVMEPPGMISIHWSVTACAKSSLPINPVTGIFWSFRMRTWRNRCALLCRSMVS